MDCSTLVAWTRPDLVYFNAINVLKVTKLLMKIHEPWQVAINCAELYGDKKMQSK